MLNRGNQPLRGHLKIVGLGLMLSLFALSALGSKVIADPSQQAPAGDDLTNTFTLKFPIGETLPYSLATGPLNNPSGEVALLYADVVYVENSASVRLFFKDTYLDTGSFIRITSMLDHEVQDLDAATLAMWSNSSAFFNGDTLLVELYGGPYTKGNQMNIERVWREEGTAYLAFNSCGICKPDDRVPSNEEWTGRLMPVGCTASVWNEDSCIVSAGHCWQSGLVIQFRVPPSNANCTVRHPPVEEQFPLGAARYLNGGVGADWMVAQVGTNNLGQKPYQRYGVLRRIDPVPANVGDPVAVWGYGTDNECTRTQTQQTHSGDVRARATTYYRYFVDITFGNSGSAIINRNTNKIIGIVTHCENVSCPTNYGTRVDNSDFASARRTLCPTTGDVNGDGCVNDTDLSAVLTRFGQNCSGCPEDLNRDGVVNDADLTIVLQNYGRGC